MELLDDLKWLVLFVIVIWLLIYLRMKKQGKEPSFTKVTKRVLNDFISKGSTDVNTGDFLKIQDQRELRRKALNQLKDRCSYCKFNLKSGKEKCDECGKEFYPTAHTYRCKECCLVVVVESLKDVEEQICPYCLTQNVIA